MTAQELGRRMREAWPLENLRALGPKQAALLRADVLTTDLENLTVDRLSSFLASIEEFCPEEWIDTEGSLKGHLKIGFAP